MAISHFSKPVNAASVAPLAERLPGLTDRVILDRVTLATKHDKEGKPMTTTHRVKGIARLIKNVHAMNDQADKLSDEMEKHMNRVASGMAATRQVVQQVKEAADELESANALFTNAPTE